MKATFAVVLVVALVFHVFAEDDGELNKHFKEADTNGDGFLSKEEAAAIGIPEELFDAADTNKDGRLSLEEASEKRW
ncbi:EF hand domain-containing protein [Ditylenchus destructor]|nr:EF hand domain-containing protein [Ditylenchus destructor]